MTAEQLKEQGNLIQYFEERLQKLQAENSRLRADRERLDWLEQRAKLDRIGIEFEGGVNMPFCLREGGWFEDYSDISDGATLRAAIDAAHVHAKS